MEGPSKDLQAMADTPKADLEAILLSWARLWKGLKIVNAWFTSTSSLAKAADFTHDEGDDDEDRIFQLHLYPTVQEFLEGKVRSEVLNVFFDTDNNASVHDASFLGVPPTFHGTWEEVTRKLFEMEKLMLEQIPKVPDDLKKQ